TGSFDLGGWLAGSLRVGPGSRLLDVGAGTGVQLLRYARHIGREGMCAAMDISASSLEMLDERAASIGLAVKTYCADMDRLKDSTFAPELSDLTHLVAVYALYYSRGLPGLLAAIHDRLAPEGSLFVVGPTHGNNGEWYALLERGELPVPRDILRVSEQFFDEELVPGSRKHFCQRARMYQENRVTFASAAELLAYWRSNIYFDEAAEGVTREIRRHFEDHAAFTITKRICLMELVNLTS
ncbi:MAG TPA: methyltransferase domain-containing protein, partial [Polyangiaceae bacterium]|nr:methyltransferase domain-containing protein [Polyangiaceae bacterium]